MAREVERAISKKKPVFPVRIENVEPSRALQAVHLRHAMDRCLLGQARDPHGSAVLARLRRRQSLSRSARRRFAHRRAGCGALALCWLRRRGDRRRACLAVQQDRANLRPGSAHRPVGHQQSGEDSRADGPGRRQAERCEFGTAQTAPADVPAYADRAEPWDNPPRLPPCSAGRALSAGPPAPEWAVRAYGE